MNPKDCRPAGSCVPNAVCCLPLALLLIAGPAPAAQSDTLRVLFLGNSYTYDNDLPVLLRDLSASGDRPVETDQYAPGGYTLMQHSTDPAGLAKVALGSWDYVVLQEQSQIPTIEYWRDSSMYPAARGLDSAITSLGQRTCFFMTWGRRYGGIQTWNGHSSPDFVDFFHMQESLRTAYTRIAEELPAELAPVGMGWARARTLNPDVDLWQADNSHPTVRGSYLAACVFFATLFDTTPVGLSFYAGLDSAEARFFQQAAEYAVLGVEESPKCELRTPNCPTIVRGVLFLPRDMGLGTRSELPGNSAMSRAALLDAGGRKVTDLVPGENDVSALPAGVYFICPGPPAAGCQPSAVRKVLVLR